MSKSTILEGPDGRLYEIPNDILSQYAVPGEQVSILRKRMASTKSPSPHGEHAAPAVHADLPPGHSAMPPGHSAVPPHPDAASPSPPSSSMSIRPGAGVTLNFYFQTSPKNSVTSVSYDTAGGVDGYHMSFDESGIPVNHTDMLWGDYVDKQGNPAVGWHSHDPVTGNAQ